MARLKTSLIAAMLAVVVTAAGLHFLNQRRTREANSLRYRNDRMRFEASQRQAAAVVPTATPTAEPAAAAVLNVPVPTVGPGIPAKPVEYYRNEGQGTPLATLQTFAWACDRGDAELVGKLLYIDPPARSKAEGFLAALPAEARVKWKTVDEMAAALLTAQGMNQPFPNADLLETATPEQVSADRVRLRLPDVPKDGTEYEKTADGWKYVVTEKMVDDYITRSKAEAPAAQRK